MLFNFQDTGTIVLLYHILHSIQIHFIHFNCEFRTRGGIYTLNLLFLIPSYNNSDDNDKDSDNDNENNNDNNNDDDIGITIKMAMT